MVDCALYVSGVRQAGGRGVADLFAEAKATPEAFVWIGLHDPTEADMARVAEVFDLHPLAVEDALSDDQRPKLERYEETAFLAVRAASYIEHTEVTDTSEVGRSMAAQCHTSAGPSRTAAPEPRIGRTWTRRRWQ
ncbi:CorA family divalent cation transporter [Dactylosporangium sp. AC04546]|uniref:CorA family divalent cation transporter n=1 Tax=Dactylosporangium sp. AC04546 TaxID=2862460 RepID=UPI001EDDF254|nr:CorA family divalent cation transporter [Dactylosporangium sp. AC04546]WVK78850.1 CorA family divalent cation transporter [Dactylosporangium sp. AC04546]